ncbi:type II toxin-antitoxin system HicB family antitoxin [Aerococcus urinae]|uniref:Type II toxin-antitoxin system HicB family antitoxin n=1 Tax=Aerococcus urinae TaxID=1376 RepID=A0A0X8FD48_9LACT|nr:type II toxin-antitoxin system HicB family antitoxin [Aerococcus urinae]AMB95148.1 pilus biosynthesis protein HicB [Aerococcus urinae]MCY3031865.1 type II toxin-antitoxin system HicB family antitoxin [Aerococcus urinae]MCY3037141.1 type II toxin-antitoxin system HicB family antitoxin [Aerococcus urinae]MCY3043912.1 type II toxin-antitoxin system HicB family antitoxin [Aerococcus urinae]MCY3046304.1 type II toxin-antitoxin system HicB family antitoxin [Aerococcus urinae]
MLVYPAIFEREDKYIIVKFPDIPAAMTQGEDLSQAYEKAVEVLGAALEDYDDYPEPSPIESVSEQFPDSDLALIGVDLVAYRRKYHSKTVRKTVTVPEWLNDLAIAKQINFSQTLTEALKEKLGV